MKHTKWSLYWYFCLSYSVTPTWAANILFFIHVNNYSHRHSIYPLAEALASRGHNVTFLAAVPPKNPHENITDFVPENLEKHMKAILLQYDVHVRMDKDNPHTMLKGSFDYAYDACEVLYDSPDFQTWIGSNPSIDLLLIDQGMCMECGTGVAYKLGAKYIIFTTLPAFPYEYDVFGYAPESSAVPEMEGGSPTTPMGFLTRVDNALMSLHWYFWYCVYSHRMDNLIRDKLGVGEKMPHVADLVRKASLILHTGDVITDYPRALPPNHVRIPGIYCKDSTKPLPLELEEFINHGESDGFVYISLGSLINPSSLPEEIKQRFFKVIRSLPRLKFLWRWDSEFPEDAPDNLLFSQWLPQSDILAHSNIRAFVTQGGKPSTTEAVWNGVPMISFPFVADQDYNVNRMVEWGVTTKLEISAFAEQELKSAIETAVYNPKTRQNITKLKRLFRDRPDDPLDTAVWWTEYVLRTPDTTHLRAAGHGQNWFIRRQIDVWVFLTVSSLLGLLSVIKIILILGRNLLRSQTVPNTLKSKLL